MTAVAAGTTSTITLAARDVLAIASNGGLGQITIMPVREAVISLSYGPLPYRQLFGPFSAGATASIFNQTSLSLDADGGTNLANLLTAAASLGRGPSVVSPGTAILFSAALTGTGPATFRIEQSDDGVNWESLGVTFTLANANGPVSDGSLVYVSKRYLSAVVLTLSAGSTINATASA